LHDPEWEIARILASNTYDSGPAGSTRRID
jgi:hypothetical protein